MRAYLELVECSGEATCSLPPGQRFALRPGSDVTLGRTAECDVVIKSRGQGGRRNCTISARGSHHELLHLRHQGTIVVGGRELNHGSHELADGDEIVPGLGLRLRYVVDRGEGRPDAGFDTELAVAGPWVVFDQSLDSWRCVPIDDPSAPPRRLLGVSGPDPLRRWRRALAAGGGTAAVRATWDDGDRRLVAIDDVAGVTLFELVERSAQHGGTLDAAFVAALLTPSLHTIVSTRVDVFIGPRVWCVSFDGDVVFDGFVQAALSGLPHFVTSESPGERLIEVVGALSERGVSLPGDLRRRPRWSTPPLPPSTGSLTTTGDAPAPTALQRLRAWIDEQPSVSPSTWRGLLAGLFAARVERERALRERLALLDAATIARLSRR